MLKKKFKNVANSKLNPKIEGDQSDAQKKQDSKKPKAIPEKITNDQEDLNDDFHQPKDLENNGKDLEENDEFDNPSDDFNVPE